MSDVLETLIWLMNPELGAGTTLREKERPSTNMFYNNVWEKADELEHTAAKGGGGMMDLDKENFDGRGVQQQAEHLRKFAERTSGYSPLVPGTGVFGALDYPQPPTHEQLVAENISKALDQLMYPKRSGDMMRDAKLSEDVSGLLSGLSAPTISRPWGFRR